MLVCGLVLCLLVGIVLLALLWLPTNLEPPDDGDDHGFS